MNIVNIKFRDTLYTLTCNNEEKVQKLADRFNARAEKLAANLSNVTNAKLALITALMLEDEIEHFAETVPQKGITEAEAAKAMSQTLDQISEYIEDLAFKLEKR